MDYIKIDLTLEEEKILEFRLYQFQGLQVAMNQFLHTNEFQYNEEHYNRLTDTYTEKYRLLNEYIITLLENKQHKDVNVQNLTYEYVKGILKVYTH